MHIHHLVFLVITVALALLPIYIAAMMTVDMQRANKYNAPRLRKARNLCTFAAGVIASPFVYVSVTAILGVQL